MSIFLSSTDCDFCFSFLLTTNKETQREDRPLDHPPVTVHPPRGNRQGDPARRVQATLCQRTSYTGAFPTTVGHREYVRACRLWGETAVGQTTDGTRNRATQAQPLCTRVGPR